jgi:thymidine phosphorylase
MIRAQGGDDRVVDDPGRLPRAPHVATVCAARSGFVVDLSPRGLAHVALALGAGRRRAGEAVDPTVGLVLLRRVGDAVRAGQPLLEVHARGEEAMGPARAAALAAVAIGDAPPLAARAGPILETLGSATR